ncbi:hypothetical protein IFT48_01860 [Pseudomonas fluorescens]|uniref:hypothetical protein n=1 Tax=Pseudomonas TaxID=286 RepID=UPI000F01A928|nr:MULTISPECIES: hypothetical protein [Pseudomonas]MBD8088707.1 hypothetical protein [Pseudomonas fluorescens]MBD8614832.1 hypothetical protein [Pseudomonas putida]MBD8681484.1 hypothetical protein [Pseudomonas sp. CFBP 13719]
MKKIFNNVSFDVIEKFSPELMLAVESCIEEGREDLDAMLESNSRFSLMMPSALAIGALEGRFMPPCREAGLTPYSSVPEKFGSLGAYAIAQAGNANALDMLKLITSLPNLTQWAEPQRNYYLDNTVNVCERFAAAACRFALDPEQGRKTAKGFHSSYLDLLGLDGEGRQSFAISDDQSQYAIDSLVHANLKGRILTDLKKRSPLNAQDILPYAGPLLVAMTITQPQIWIEQGHDPDRVKDIIDRRVRGFWGMARLPYEIVDELAETAIQAALLPYPGLRSERDPSFWGISIETCKKVGPAKTLDVAKIFPVVTAGGMALFQPPKSRSTSLPADTFGFIGQPEYANRLLGMPWQNTLCTQTADRVGVWVLGKYKAQWPLFKDSVLRQSLVDWHMKSTRQSPKHPLIPTYLHWHEFLEGQEWEQMCLRKILSKPRADHVYVFLREFAATEPNRFDEMAYPLLSDLRRTSIREALMPHVTGSMRSVSQISSEQRDRAFSSDLGL